MPSGAPLFRKMGGMLGMRQVGTGHLVRRFHVSSVVGCVFDLVCVCSFERAS